MTPTQPNANALRRIVDNPKLAECGVKAELAGPRSLKITRNGRFVGVWRHALGSFDWYPAGYNQPQYRVPTADDVARHLTAVGH